jgi:translation elongation factor EF-Ts
MAYSVSRLAEDGTRMAMVEVNIETDFAAKNEKFIAFVSKVAQTLFDNGDLDSVSEALNAERETLVPGNRRKYDHSSWPGG